jgi:hypothetical protein
MGLSQTERETEAQGEAHILMEGPSSLSFVPAYLPELTIVLHSHLGRPSWTPTSINYSHSCILLYHAITA